MCIRDRDKEGENEKSRKPGAKKSKKIVLKASVVTKFPVSATEISDRPMGLGFHTVRGGFDQRNHSFLPQVVGVVHVWRDF